MSISHSPLIFTEHVSVGYVVKSDAEIKESTTKAVIISLHEIG